MKYEFKKFNLLAEQTKKDLICEVSMESLLAGFRKNWSLKDELKAILPHIIKKLEYAFGNFYDEGKPGVHAFGEPTSITAINSGSSKTGFKLVWRLDGAYAETVLDCLLQNDTSSFGGGESNSEETNAENNAGEETSTTTTESSDILLKEDEDNSSNTESSGGSRKRK